MLKRFNGSSFVDIGSLKRWSGSAWEGVQTVKRWSGSAWETVWTALSVAVGGGFSQTSSGNNRYTDIGSFYVTRTPTTSPAPTAWSWELNDTGGQLSFFSGATSANFSCRGPQWQFGNFNPTFQADVRCTVTIEGKQYTTPWATFYYTGSGDL
ncbi:hypothetical protein [Brevundimonas phage AA]|uniref:Uncharacterized protein n=1 Tax=Brevundimonas phage AA TaxID=2880937 RepID=A0AAN0MNN4_9CAUD|nr:hypothetical protein [Brevundimonas phage BC]UCR90894.1 hypothetical protein [Brevundimonas phage AA]